MHSHVLRTFLYLYLIKLGFYFSSFLSFNKEIEILDRPIPNIMNAVLVSNSPKTDNTVTAIPIAIPIPLSAVSTISSTLFLLIFSLVSVFTCIKSSTETSKISANLGMEFISGKDKSLSHLETALSVTPIFSASSNCVIPFSFLNDEIIMPSVCFFICSFLLVFDDCIVSHPFKFTQPTISLVGLTVSLPTIFLL